MCSIGRIMVRAGLGLMAVCAPLRAQADTNDAIAPAVDSAFYNLEQFGPVGTMAQADATFTRASSNIIAAGGGVIVLPTNAPSGWFPRNTSQQVWRTPEPPAPAKRWGAGPGVTVVDPRGKNMKVITPQVSGLEVSRTLDLPEGESLPFWDYFPMLSLKNTILHGSTSYREWLLEDVKAGKDRRFHVKTIRGVFPGMFMSIGEYGIVQRLYVKSLGYDKDKKLWYFTADVEADLRKGTIMGNKNHVNVMRMDTYSHNENQSCDVFLERHNYSQGDNYMFYARFKYMGDNHSTAGDENAILYGAFINAESDIFRGKVEQWNPETGELKIQPGAKTDTLGSGRPMINLNHAKWLTNGTVTVGGGTIRFSADAGITEEVVGRYFAVDEPDEYVPKGKNVRRWYLIDKVDRRLNGTADIKVIRHWWGAKESGNLNLYKLDNISQDGRTKQLRYVIAPGANAYDVSGAVKKNKPVVKITPTPFTGTSVDFAAGDALEQAVGPDPFHPIAFRSWIWDDVPSSFPSPVFDVANYGNVMRHSALSVRGGSMNFKDDVEKRYDRNPPWHTIISLEAASHNGIRFMADVGSSAILFSQPHNKRQPIKWTYRPADGTGEKFASLTVTTTNGDFNFDGGDLRVHGAVVAKGLSAGPEPARNLRGKNVPVETGGTKIPVRFSVGEADGDYAVFIEPTWLGNHAIVEKGAEGFTVEFEKPAPGGAKFDWMIVR